MSNGMGFGADDAQDGSYGDHDYGGDSGDGGFTQAMRDAMRTAMAMRGRAAPPGWGGISGLGISTPSPLDPMSAGLGRRGIAPPNWGGFDTQQAYGNFKGLNPNWGDWDQQQANVGALKGFGPWSNVTSPFEPMSGGSISRGYTEPDYNEGGW